MSQLTVNFGKNFDNEVDLRRSSRQYCNLKLHSYSEIIADYLSQRSWTGVSLLIGSITEVQCSRLLGILAPTVTEFELYIENIIPTEAEDSIRMIPIDFQALEKITFRWTARKIFEPFLGTENNRLKVINIEISKSGFHEVVRDLLLRNENISSLSLRLCNDDYGRLFSEDFAAGLKIKLQTLSFYWRNTDFIEPLAAENWKRFLASQKHCLKRLVFECTFDCKSILEMIVNDMTSLEHITLVDLDDKTLRLSDKIDFKLQPNSSLKQLDVCVNWFIGDEMFSELVVAAVNLELIYIFELSIQSMKFLAENAKNLKHLIYEEIESDCEEFYSDLIATGDERVNKSIQLHWEQDFEDDYPELHQNMQFT